MSCNAVTAPATSTAGRGDARPQSCTSQRARLRGPAAPSQGHCPERMLCLPGALPPPLLCPSAAWSLWQLSPCPLPALPRLPDTLMGRPGSPESTVGHSRERLFSRERSRRGRILRDPAPV